MSVRRRLLRDEEGSILPLVFVFVAVVLALVLVTTAATSLYVDRKRLLSLADGAAVEAAEGYDLDDVTLEGDVVRPVLTDGDVRAAARAYLDDADTALDDVALAAASTPDGRSASVTVAAHWAPPVLTIVLPEGVTIRATSSARSVFR